MFNMFRAYRCLKRRFEDSSLCCWKTNPKAESPYGYGVTLHWPGEREAIDKEIEQIRNVSNEVAQDYNLEAIVSGPTLAAGGAHVVYVGLRKNPEYLLGLPILLYDK
ncbi:hypothetical protein KY312_04795 [Candidatus Woesearchaeota archaeon]|nr:hypothetical protein [Candidatus Woesearchaeota archaeon]